MADTTGKMLLDRLEYLAQTTLEGDATYEEAELLWEKAICNTILRGDVADMESIREAVGGLRALFEHAMRHVPRSGNQKLYYLH